MTFPNFFVLSVIWFMALFPTGDGRPELLIKRESRFFPETLS
jgi:hypothetical protein